MEVEYQTLDPLRSNFRTTSHYKPYKVFKEPSFEFKVIYLRTISSSDMQSCLTLIFPPRDLHSCLQINGVKILPNEKTTRPLNKHREDEFMSESVHVNTDRIKFKGTCLPFQVQIQQSSCVLVSGVLRRKEGGEDECMWVMECKEGDGVKEFNGGTLDVYFAGRSLGKPVLLNVVVDLKGWKELESTTQGDEAKGDTSKESEAKSIEEVEHQREDHELNQDEEEHMLVEEGELSWFNAGVKIGIGLSVGMTLGVGVGIGLMIRTYKTTSGVLKKLMV